MAAKLPFFLKRINALQQFLLIVNGGYIIFENHQLFGSIYDTHQTLV
jgi:hypothetical protein